MTLIQQIFTEQSKSRLINMSNQNSIAFKNVIISANQFNLFNLWPVLNSIQMTMI